MITYLHNLKISKLIPHSIVILVIFLIFFGLIFGGVISNGDSLFSFLLYFIKASENSGIISQNILLGFPLFVSNTGTWFIPGISGIAHIIDPIFLYNWLIIISVGLTYYATYIFARSHFRDVYVSHITAAVFTFAGQLMLWVETHANALYYPLLPLTLYVSYRTLRNSSSIVRLILGGIISGVILGLGWRIGHVQYIVYIHTFFGVYGLYTLYELRNTFSRMYARVLLYIVIAYAVSFIVGLPQILAILNFRGETMRAEGVGITSVFDGAYHIQDTLRFLLPFIKIEPIAWSNPNLYIGILPFIILIASLFSWKYIKNSAYRFWYIVFIFCSVYGIVYSPLAWLFHKFPLWNSFREAPRLMFIGWFAGACIVGYLVQALVDNHENIKLVFLRTLSIYRKFFIRVLLPLISFATLFFVFGKGKLLILIETLVDSRISSGVYALTKEHYMRVAENYIEGLRYLTIFDRNVIILILVSLCVIWCISKAIKHTQILSLSIFLIIMINFAGVYAFHFEFLERVNVLSEPESVRIIRNHESRTNSRLPFRIASILPGATIYNEVIVRCGKDRIKDIFPYQKELLQPNINMLYNIDSIDGYDNFMPERVSKILATLGTEQTLHTDSLSMASMSIEAKMSEIGKKYDVYRFLNTKYIISAYPIYHENINLIDEYYFGDCKLPVKVYEVNNVLPRYFTVRALPNSYVDIQPLQILEPHYTRLETILNIKNAHEEILIIGNAYLKNYRIFINDIETSYESAYDIYMSVKIPQGDNTIKIQYLDS